MVSRIYTPLVTPYSRPQTTRSSDTIIENPFENETAIAADNGDLQQKSAGLKAVQTDPFQKISLDAVLHDFQSTIDALGADDQTRSEVTAYLKVVGLQGSKEQPEVPFIKQTLKTAAGTLDQFITQALGQPSHVVKEWVDALLLQNIDYHVTEMPAWVESTSKPSQTQPPAVSSFDNAAKTQIKNLIETAKSQFKQGDSASADTSIQQSLDLLSNYEEPLWNGKVWQLRARFQDKSGNWEQSVNAYKQAAQHFETGNRSDLQAESLYNAASILDEHGQSEQAITHYQTVLGLDTQQGNPQNLLNTMNDLGNAYLRQGNFSDAVSMLENAARATLNTTTDPAVQSDVFNNLGAAYRYQQNYDSATQAFQQALKLSKQSQDKSRYTSSLQQLAATFVDANQPHQAMKALQRLTQLQSA